MKETLFTLNDAIDLVVAGIKSGNLPGPCAWGNVVDRKFPGRSQSMILYSAMISTLARGAIDQCNGDVIEIGTDYGLGAFALSYGIRRHPANKVITFDIQEKIVQSTKKRAETLGASNIVFVHGTSDDIGKYGEGFSFAYIDGGHKFEDCFADLKNLAPRMHVNGLILCHDLFFIERPGLNGVRKAIMEFVKQNPNWVATRVGGFGLLGMNISVERVK